MKKHLKIKKIRVIVILILMFVFTSGMKIISVEDSYPVKEPELVVYKVTKGDTLWSIAKYYEVEDTKRFVSDTIKLNRLNQSMIYPGDKICIPINY